MIRDGSIQVPGAGMHQYVWGHVRFSVWLVLAAWLASAVAVQAYLEPFRAVHGYSGIAAVGCAIYAAGVVMTRDHPFLPEIAAAWLWRTLRRAHSLRS